MPRDSKRIRVLALLLMVIFLGAQFHYCADFNSGPDSSHICPVCSAAATVVAVQLPSVAFVPVLNDFEAPVLLLPATAGSPRALAPRAPPAA